MAETAPASPRSKARIAGVLYLLVIIGALVVPFAVAPTGMMMGDAALPAAGKILASRPLYILSGAGQLMVGACDVAVAVLLYALLRPVNASLALLAAFFRLVFVAVAGANVANHFAALLLLSGPETLAAFRPDQLQALARMFLRLRVIGFDIALVFFGLHCVVLGYLVFRSTFFPRILGLLLAFGGAAYLANIFANVLPATLAAWLFPAIMLPAGVAELLFAFWLIIVGVNVAKWRAAQAGAR